MTKPMGRTDVFAGMPTLSVRFDLGKVKTGYDCWRLLWQALQPQDFPGVFLFDGSGASRNAKKGTFCIALQSFSPQTLERVRTAILASPDLLRKCARPAIAIGSDHIGAELTEVGRIDYRGSIVPCASECVAALDSIE